MKPFELLLLFVVLFIYVSLEFVPSVELTLPETVECSLNTNDDDGILRMDHPSAENEFTLWPNGEIAYSFNSSLLTEEKCHIEKAMYDIMWNSCIRFRMKFQNDTDGIDFDNVDQKIMPELVNRDSHRNRWRTTERKVSVDSENVRDDFRYERKRKSPRSKLNFEALNELYKCANPLRPSYDFMLQFVEHYYRCVDKIYYDINRYNSLLKNGNSLNKSNRKRSISPNEIIVQGDILIRDNKQAAFSDGNVQSSALNPAITEPYSNKTTWTNGIIPYELDSSLEAHKCLIENAMLQIMLNTCIRFRPRNDRDTFYVRILQDPRHSCYAYIGMDLQNYITKVSLPYGCLDIGTVVHELMHAIGFYHHHNRQDRDEHVKIHDENIQPKMSINFDLNDPLVEQIFTPWDYDSVMLYGAKFFSKDNRSITIEPTVPGVVLKNVYDKPGLSKFDAIAINQLYKCSNVRYSNFYSDLSLMKPMLKLVKSCNASNDTKSYQYIFRQCRRKSFRRQNETLNKVISNLFGPFG